MPSSPAPTSPSGPQDRSTSTQPPFIPTGVTQARPSSVGISHHAVKIDADNYEVVLRLHGKDVPLTQDQWDKVAPDLQDVVQKYKKQLDEGEQITFSAEKLSADRTKMSAVKEGKKDNRVARYDVQKAALKVLNTVAGTGKPEKPLTREQQLEAEVKTLKEQNSILKAANVNLQRDKDSLRMLHKDMERIQKEHKDALQAAREEGRQEVVAEMQDLLDARVSEASSTIHEEFQSQLTEQGKNFAAQLAGKDEEIRRLTEQVASGKAALAGLESDRGAKETLGRAHEEAIAALKQQHEEGLRALKAEHERTTTSLSAERDAASSRSSALEEEVERLQEAAKGHDAALAKINVEKDGAIQGLAKDVASGKTALAGVEQSNKEAMAGLGQAYEEAIAALKHQHDEALAALMAEHKQTRASLSAEKEATLERHEEELTAAEGENEKLQEQMLKLTQSLKLAQGDVEAAHELDESRKEEAFEAIVSEARQQIEEQALENEAQLREEFDEAIQKLNEKVVIGEAARAGLERSNAGLERLNKGLEDENQKLKTRLSIRLQFGGYENEAENVQEGDLVDVGNNEGPIGLEETIRDGISRGLQEVEERYHEELAEKDAEIQRLEDALAATGQDPSDETLSLGEGDETASSGGEDTAVPKEGDQENSL